MLSRNLSIIRVASDEVAHPHLFGEDGQEGEGFEVSQTGREEGSGQEVKEHSRVGASEPSALADQGLTAFS
jgi:hypothetical protein